MFDAVVLTGSLLVANVTLPVADVTLFEQSPQVAHVDRTALHETARPLIPHQSRLTEELAHLRIGQPLRARTRSEKEHGKQGTDEDANHVAPQALGKRHDAKMGVAAS